MNYLCSIAPYLSIYKNRIDFRTIPKNEKNLELILERTTMNKEQIETIIENLAKSGYKFQSEKNRRRLY